MSICYWQIPKSNVLAAVNCVNNCSLPIRKGQRMLVGVCDRESCSGSVFLPVVKV